MSPAAKRLAAARAAGATVITGIPIRPDLKKPCPFEIGQHVRRKDRPDMKGVVATLPRGPVVKLGSHVVGNTMGVDLDPPFEGSRAIAEVDDWEASKKEPPNPSHPPPPIHPGARAL